jgi:1,4-alpha-glucan branching enzyme
LNKEGGVAMIYKTRSMLPGHVHIVFELPSCIWADHIALVGDFNQWNEKATFMCQDHEGVWRAEIDLPLGRCYEFRYLIDGEWKTDYHADGFAINRFGSDNSVVLAELPESLLAVERLSSQVWNHTHHTIKNRPDGASV